MEKLQSLSTSLIYPQYEFKEGLIKINPGTMSPDKFIEFSLRIMTHIRKQHEGTWYLIPVVMSFTRMIPIEDIELYKSECRDLLMRQFHAEVYKAILFYIVDPRNARIDQYTDMYKKIALFVDVDQRSEKERLSITV